MSTLDPILPLPVIGLAGIVMLFLTVRVYWRIGALVGRWRRFALAALRISGITLVLLLLLQPSVRDLLPPPARDRVTVIGLDSSKSMNQRDAGGKSRFDAARELLLDSNMSASTSAVGGADAGVATEEGAPPEMPLRVFEFSDDARPIAGSLLELSAAGKTTRFHDSLATMLNVSGSGDQVNAVILLTDGHDFELVNPAKSGMLAHNRDAPIYAVAFGKQGQVRDVAARISGYQPYCYVKQKARINAVLRLVGCELEDLSVQLLRQGQVTQTKRVNAQQLQELPVEFEVSEPDTGQFEYEVRVLPLDGEVDSANNSAITYLNVIDQQIRVLLLEGDPYWDTTFLQRSLMRNDKFDVDALVRYGRDRLRATRKSPESGELKLPRTVDEAVAYDVIILGREVQRVVGVGIGEPEPGPGGLLALEDPAGSFVRVLEQYVSDRSGTVIFSRGGAFGNSGSSELDPAAWGGKRRERVQLGLTAEGRGLSPFRVLNDEAGGFDGLPELLDARSPQELKPLTSTFAVSTVRTEATPEAAVVHRRYGRGQVMSIGVAGLWRWALNSKLADVNAPLDRFWDQMILWLLAGRDFIPSKQYSFRPNSANILLGEKVYFRLVLRDPEPGLKSAPVTVYFGDAEAGRLNLTPAPASAGRLAGDFLPERTGKYRAAVNLPDGTTQESRFVVFTENLEETEVATDGLYLRRLCESSGGRVLAPEDLPKLLRELNTTKLDDTPKTVIRPIWNAAWVFYLAGVFFGLDWFLRRRWGLC